MMDAAEALLRAATYLKWFRDRAITVDTKPPDAIGEIIVTLEQVAGEQRERQRAADDLELAELLRATRPLDQPPDD